MPVFKNNKQLLHFFLFVGATSQVTSHRIFLNFLRNNIFFVNKINAKKEKNQFGNYKISNEINDIKKVIFLFVLISQIFQSSYKNKVVKKKKFVKKQSDLKYEKNK